MSSHYLVESSVGARLLQAFKSPAAFDAEQRERFETRMAAKPARARSAPSVSGDAVAQINVHGLLVSQPDFLAFLVGLEQTSYGDIRDALASAAADPSVSRVVVHIDSPGGNVHGLFETLQALDAFSKPISVVASLACSAAYAIAAVAGSIQATTPASVFGSVGVVRTYYADGPHASELQIEITSTNAPNKRPNVTTTEGKAVVQAELDAIHELFVEAIARGRKTSASSVNTDFGRGGIVLAHEARRKNMIDSIAPAPRKPGTAQTLADPGKNLSLYLTQRFGGPHLGESVDEFAERQVSFMARCRAIAQAGGSIRDYDALFEDGAVVAARARPSLIDRFAADLDGKPDLGDLVVAEMQRRRSPQTNEDLVAQFASDLPHVPGNSDEPGDLGDQIVARLEAQRGGSRRTERTP